MQNDRGGLRESLLPLLQIGWVPDVEEQQQSIPRAAGQQRGCSVRECLCVVDVCLLQVSPSNGPIWEDH